MKSQDIFKETASYYRKYRPRHPDIFLQQVVNSIAPKSTDKLLDLGCGTGQIALSLCSFFNNVTAVDANKNMLSEGRAEADKSGIDNISWQQSRAENVDELNKVFDITIIASAFHWMDRKVVLDKLYDTTTEGGGVAIIGVKTTSDESWWEDIKYLIEEYTDSTQKPERPKQIKRHEQMIEESQFEFLEPVRYSYQRDWTADELLGMIFSLSYAKKSMFGEKLAEFETKSKKIIDDETGQDGVYTENVTSIALLGKK